MPQVPFQVVCTSCESILEVRNPELVGQIVACPKCGGMVLLAPQQPVPVAEPPIPEPPKHVPSIIENATPEVAIDETPVDAEPVTSPERENAGQLGPLAAELHAKYLADVRFDDWRKRRLVIVGVGTFCLLAVFAAFLLLKPETPRIDKPPEKTSTNAQTPIPPDGIEKTRTTGQANDALKEGTPAIEGNGNAGGLPLPPADQIDVEHPETRENQRETDETQTETTTSQPTTVAEPSDVVNDASKSTAVSVAPRRNGGFIDPFGDVFDDANVNAGNPGDVPFDYAAVTMPGHAENDTDVASEADGFSGLLDDDQQPDDTLNHVSDNVTEIGMTGDENIGEIEVTRPDIRMEPGDIEGAVDSLKQEFAISAERRKIDIDERLQQSVESIRFEKAAIIDVVRAISDLSGVPMQLDVDELRARGIGVEAPISLQLSGTTLAEIVDAVLQKTRLIRHDGDDYIVFGYPDDQEAALRTVRYDMSQLASLAQNPIPTERAAQWLSELLLKQSQNPKTRDATVAVDGNEIVVVGTIRLQDQARRLLLTLFYLREVEPETKLTPERLAPEVFGWDRVNTPLSFNPVEPMPLKRAARLIERHVKLRLLIDHAALHEEGLSRETPVACNVTHGTIDTVLREMLEPLGLTYRIVEANAVEITTPIAARRKMTIEAQQYSPLPAGKTPEAIAETMRQAFGGVDRWNAETGGVIVIDDVSGYMLVRQSQPLQRDIRLWFGRMHSEEGHVDDAETGDDSGDAETEMNDVE